MTKEQEKANKAVESFKNFIKSKENEQNTLYENEEFYRDGIEQNELFLEMLHTVLNLIQTQQEEIEKKERTINLMSNYIVNLIQYNNPEEVRNAKEIKQYFERKINNVK